jgi:2-haloacid dehalogenase
LGLKPSESMMVAAHDGDLAAARSAGLHTALVSVPEEDNMAEGFEPPSETNFDIEAQDFEALCQNLGA